MRTWRDAVRELEQDRARGASQLLELALDALALAANEAHGQSPAAYAAHFSAAAGAVAAARPTMVAIGACARRVLQQVQEAAGGHGSAEAIRRSALAAIDRVRAQAREARRQAITRAAELAATADCIVTCSFSSTVVEAIALAAGCAPHLQVRVLASRWQGRSYGAATAAALQERHVHCQVFDDDALAAAVAGARLALVGADAVTEHGTLINGTPSLALARACRRARPPVPFLAVCESLKVVPGVQALEPGFDAVPAALVTGFVSEHGVASPEGVAAWRSGSPAEAGPP
ncbi:MAG: hypothetical protein QHH05_02010 [Syntrophomonadaceae bacterium]|jgi:translation initiation factor eIF-2B subunit delta|nr:hypothetical protein [Syntrophomonadaceae bacterium]MDH7497211.1 hypothetical protein [Syntrophomonadaceae bacterium]